MCERRVASGFTTPLLVGRFTPKVVIRENMLQFKILLEKVIRKASLHFLNWSE